MNKPSSERGMDCVVLCDVGGDGQDERDPL
jgi:hypothetical protein